ncbi:MAG TPA: hypothetical protein VGF77_10495 [Allosphingosinicella sp.]|jgi:hypothetical protein
MAYQDGDSRTYGGVTYVRQNGLWYPQPDAMLSAAQGGGAPDDASQGNPSDASAPATADPGQLVGQIAQAKDQFVNATDPGQKVNALWQLGSLIMAASQQPQQGDAGNGGGANGNSPQPAPPAQNQQNAPQEPDDGGSGAPRRPLPPPLLGQSQGSGGGDDGSGIPLLPSGQQNPPPFAADLPGAPGGSDDGQQPSALSLLSSGQQMPPPFVAGLAGAPGGAANALQQLGAPLLPTQDQQNAPQGAGGGGRLPQQLLPPSFWDQPQGPGGASGQQSSGIPLPPPDQQNPPPFVADLPGPPGGSDGSQPPSAPPSGPQMPPPFVAGLAGAPGGVASALQQLGALGGMAGALPQFAVPSPAQSQQNAPQGPSQQNPPPFVAELAGAPDGTGSALQQSGTLFSAGPGGTANPARSRSLFAPGNQPRVLQPIPPIDSSLPGMPMDGLVPPFAVPQPAGRLTLDDVYHRFSQILHIGEGGDDSYNTGTKGLHGRVGYSSINPPAGMVTGKTINQILSTDGLPATDHRRMHTVGRYQMVHDTLSNAAKALGLTGNERLTRELQDRIYRSYLIPSAGNGALGRFLTKGVGTVDQAQYAAAHQWASIAVPKGLRRGKAAGYQISDGTMSYYPKPANAASMRETHAIRSLLTQWQQQRGN